MSINSGLTVLTCNHKYLYRTMNRHPFWDTTYDWYQTQASTCKQHHSNLMGHLNEVYGFCKRIQHFWTLSLHKNKTEEHQCENCVTLQINVQTNKLSISNAKTFKRHSQRKSLAAAAWNTVCTMCISVCSNMFLPPTVAFIDHCKDQTTWTNNSTYYIKIPLILKRFIVMVKFKSVYSDLKSYTPYSMWTSERAVKLKMNIAQTFVWIMPIKCCSDDDMLRKKISEWHKMIPLVGSPWVLHDCPQLRDVPAKYHSSFSDSHQ